MEFERKRFAHYHEQLEPQDRPGRLVALYLPPHRIPPSSGLLSPMTQDVYTPVLRIGTDTSTSGEKAVGQRLRHRRCSLDQRPLELASSVQITDRKRRFTCRSRRGDHLSSECDRIAFSDPRFVLALSLALGRSSVLVSEPPPLWCQDGTARIRQLRPDAGLGFQV